MIKFAKSRSEYFTELKSFGMDSVPPLTLKEGSLFFKAAVDFATRRHVLSTVRLLRLRRLMYAAVKEGIVGPFRLHFSFKVKDFAYMTDSGDVYLSVFKIVRSADIQNFKIALHELGHIYISGMAGYADLLRLDAEVVEALGKTENAAILSPVEVYATAVGCALISAVADMASGKFKSAAEALVSEEVNKILTSLKETPISET